MIIEEQSHNILLFDKEKELYKICSGYCKCYRRPIPKTFEEQCEFVRKHRQHGSPKEHGYLTVEFVTNRGVSHELVRHRHAGYSQQSTRYCNYTKDRFNNQLTFIQDSAVMAAQEYYDIWIEGLRRTEEEYFNRIKGGQKPEEARGCLPNDLKTEIQVSANLREWHDIFRLRCAPSAHYQMRELIIPLAREMKKQLPCLFDDLDPSIYGI